LSQWRRWWCSLFRPFVFRNMAVGLDQLFPCGCLAPSPASLLLLLPLLMLLMLLLLLMLLQVFRRSLQWLRLLKFAQLIRPQRPIAIHWPFVLWLRVLL